MATRVLVTLSGDSDPERVVHALRDLGPATVHAPAPELPGVAVAEVDDDAVESFVHDARSIEGVSVAEVDTLSSTQRAEPQSSGPRSAEPSDTSPGWSSTS
ncbi:hypothetical protein N865_08795 [Intrasporangium oryzae NRRL B-24470]|uniref:Uncharacterized protein n=1 Tax=Intrasporangium oryzae NRRL B-24470 TaxID=1386089 RepID=W9GBU2_9MICO|nr:hypothetical protein [Intrasporangium oryzae]EWT03681.1 hypothetical protein N865_08795 [Intrasporangium oryzae NRRL B-24470]